MKLASPPHSVATGTHPACAI